MISTSYTRYDIIILAIQYNAFANIPVVVDDVKNDLYYQKIQDFADFLNEHTNELVMLPRVHVQFPDNNLYFTVQRHLFTNRDFSSAIIDQKPVDDLFKNLQKRLKAVKCSKCMFVNWKNAVCVSEKCYAVNERSKNMIFYDYTHINVLGSLYYGKMVRNIVRKKRLETRTGESILSAELASPKDILIFYLMDPRSSNNSDDELDDNLYNEFEQACSSVSGLFKAPTWRTFQTAAVHTTQLYKAGSEASKRALEKGIQQGRLQMAKELLALKRYGAKLDATDVYNILQKYALLPNEYSIPQRPRRFASPVDGGVHQAVTLFQQALNPPNVSPNSQHRPQELNAFLHNQVLRHRKRTHSPMDTNMNNHFSKRKR
ncbi:unnamed protein product [Bursaphelenchus okinawaensis]|uniref:SGNH domain-containing protein n=1 Tax=Bursaphelenchus okinawaensis TaxID=465554 RepID=A0A811JWG8_9BILA|nr:unnamed protein product [Bursaphelenchus okinawaensis]CAG9086763.1 unnamed protein product [Bursaphelenchus okinawaensis]